MQYYGAEFIKRLHYLHIKKFSENTVESIGLTLFPPCGFLGCSADGLVITKDGKRRVLEIKCLWKYRENTIIEMIENEFRGRELAPTFYLNKNAQLNKITDIGTKFKGVLLYVCKTLLQLQRTASVQIKMDGD